MQLDTSDDPWTTANYDQGTRRGTGVASLPRPAHESEGNQSEMALRESERLFRTMFERSVVGIACVAPDGRWLSANQQLCDLLGYTRDELATYTIKDLVHPDDLEDELARVQRALAGELDADERDKRFVRKDGNPIWAHLTVSLVRTSEGEPDYFIAMVQDITERKRLEQERARLLQREHEARRELETTNTQFQALQALTDTALSHLALDELLGELLDRLIAVMGVDHIAIFLLDPDGRTLNMRAARGAGKEHVGRVRVTVGPGFTGRIAASRAPLIANDLSAAEFAEVHPLLRETARSAVGVPLLVQAPVKDCADNRLVGVITVGSAALRRFTDADVQLLQRAADRIALAIDRARLYKTQQDARCLAEAALTQARESEAQSATRADQLHTILDTIADGVAVLDTEGRVQLANRAYRELHGLERLPAEYEALPLRERASFLNGRDATTGAPLPAEAWPGARALRGEVVTGPGVDIRVRTFDGREQEHNCTAAPLREPDGRIAGAVVVLRDLTERNRLAREREEARADEVAARETSRQLEAFLAIAAHDLRTPLTALVGYLALATRQAERLAIAVRGESSELLRYVTAVRTRLEDADQSADRLTRLLSRLFDLTAIRTGKLELHNEPFDLAALVREQVTAQRVAAPERTIRLRVPARGQPILVEADADRIGQVVANYLSNALKYAPPNRPVDVVVAARGGQARITVRDQGPGLPQEERARIWEEFHRAPGVEGQCDVSCGARSGSLGLGLYISKAIIEAHGGQVGVESEPGKGSTFWFTVPLAGVGLDVDCQLGNPL